MYNIEFNGDELRTLITTLEIEEYRIRQYYGALLQHKDNTVVSGYDKKRINDINALIDKLSKVRGGQ
jgi:hypothetical protein